VNDSIPAVEKRGRPKTMADDVLDAERRHLKREKQKPNQMDYRG